MWLSRLILVFSLLTGCAGYHPILAGNKDVLKKVNSTKIVIVGDFEDRNDLFNILKFKYGFNTVKEYKYLLSIRLAGDNIKEATKKDSYATRNENRQTIDFKLISISSKKVLISDTISEISGSDISFESDYKNFVATIYNKTNNLENLSKDLANKIYITFLKK